MLGRALAIGLSIGVATSASAASITDVYTSFYAFGDSLTDDGKFGSLPSEVSLGGRFTNGPTWAEIVADVFEAGGRDTGNLAVGGATAGDGGNFTPLSNFNGQIDAFLGSVAFDLGLPTKLVPFETASEAPDPGDNPLISVWLGANDLFASFLPDDVIAAAQSVADGITRIATSTLGNFDDFLVANLPDLGSTPAYNSLLRLAGQSEDQIALASQAATQATDLFNEQLAMQIALLEQDLGINIIAYDAAASGADVFENPENYPFTSLTMPCTVSLSSDSNLFTCFPEEQDSLYFTDGVHPNRVVHELIAGDVLAAIAPVPLPATAPLVLLGLAGLGWAGRRRKAA